jgi:toxin CcdB
VPQQFDLVENLNSARRRQYPFLIVLQHNRVASIDIVVVAPVANAHSSLMGTRLHPALDLAGSTYVVLVEQMAAVSRQTLGRVVGSADPWRYQIVAAIDLLFTGI